MSLNVNALAMPVPGMAVPGAALAWPFQRGTAAPIFRWLSENLSGPEAESSASTPAGESPGFAHITVLRDEAVEWLRPGPGKVIVDGTLGGGGHSEALLEAGATVIGMDKDPAALAHARGRLAKFGDRFSAHHGDFAGMRTLLESLGIEKVDGILLDLGVSSHQLDTAERGFSFQQEGPLDMRMNPEADVTAATLVNEADEVELARVFWEYGEENASRRIARSIVKTREDRPLATTGDLAAAVEKVSPRRGKKHPATKVFQALRIAVNDELGALETALRDSVDLLSPGGRLAIISFHSLEDRCVKRFFRDHSQRWLDRPEWPEPKLNPDFHFSLPLKKALAPGEVEVRANPRSRSARLRVAEKL